MPAPDRISPQSRDTRVATSVTLLGAVACVALAAVASLGQWPSSAATQRHASARQPALMQAVGPAPAFCKNQTWPDIDMRCLNRVEPKVAEAPANEPAASPAPAPAVATTAPLATPPAPEQNQAEQAPAQPPSDVANADSTVGMSSGDVWPEQPTSRPQRRSYRSSAGWNLPSSRSAW